MGAQQKPNTSTVNNKLLQQSVSINQQLSGLKKKIENVSQQQSSPRSKQLIHKQQLLQQQIGDQMTGRSCDVESGQEESPTQSTPHSLSSSQKPSPRLSQHNANAGKQRMSCRSERHSHIQGNQQFQYSPRASAHVVKHHHSPNTTYPVAGEGHQHITSHKEQNQQSPGQSKSESNISFTDQDREIQKDLHADVPKRIQPRQTIQGGAPIRLRKFSYPKSSTGENDVDEEEESDETKELHQRLLRGLKLGGELDEDNENDYADQEFEDEEFGDRTTLANSSGEEKAKGKGFRDEDERNSFYFYPPVSVYSNHPANQVTHNLWLEKQEKEKAERLTTIVQANSQLAEAQNNGPSKVAEKNTSKPELLAETASDDIAVGQRNDYFDIASNHSSASSYNFPIVSHFATNHPSSLSLSQSSVSVQQEMQPSNSIFGLAIEQKENMITEQGSNAQLTPIVKAASQEKLESKKKTSWGPIPIISGAGDDADDGIPSNYVKLDEEMTWTLDDAFSALEKANSDQIKQQEELFFVQLQGSDSGLGIPTVEPSIQSQEGSSHSRLKDNGTKSTSKGELKQDNGDKGLGGTSSINSKTDLKLGKSTSQKSQISQRQKTPSQAAQAKQTTLVTALLYCIALSCTALYCIGLDCIVARSENSIDSHCCSPVRLRIVTFK
jgi:hypothetical protein